MARKPNYSFEKRQRELAKAEKKAARQEARVRRRERQSAEKESGEERSGGRRDPDPGIGRRGPGAGPPSRRRG